jgi:alcohol dehydrogenase
MGQCVVFEGAGRPLQICSMPVPQPRRGEILVRNEYATLCRSDLSTYSGRRLEAVPTILGHEVVGRIVALGEQVPERDLLGFRLAIGDRLAWAIYASDPTHTMARRGLPQKVPGMLKYGHTELTAHCAWHGGLAEFTLLRAHTPIVRLGDDVPVQVAALTNCALATAAAALRLAGSVLDRRVLVLGAGALGLAAAAQAKVGGSRWVGVLDRDAERAELARRFGADAVGAAAAAGSLFDGVDVAIDCTGHPDAMGTSLQLLAVGGIAVWVGAVAPVGTVAIDPERLVRRLLTVRGLHNYTADDLAAAAAFVQGNHRRFPFVELVQEEFALADAEAAFRCAEGGSVHRVGVRCGG